MNTNIIINQKELKIKYKKEKDLHNKIDEILLKFIKEYEKCQSPPTELVISLGKTIKIEKENN
jgi:hypothetical protein